MRFTPNPGYTDKDASISLSMNFNLANGGTKEKEIVDAMTKSIAIKIPAIVNPADQARLEEAKTALEAMGDI